MAGKNPILYQYMATSRFYVVTMMWAIPPLCRTGDSRAHMNFWQSPGMLVVIQLFVKKCHIFSAPLPLGFEGSVVGWNCTGLPNNFCAGERPSL